MLRAGRLSRAPGREGAARRRALVATLGAVCLVPLLSACASRPVLNASLQITPEQVERAKARAKALIQTGADPSQVYTRLTKEANVRVSPEVILRKAAACWPQQELAYEIAQQGDDSDAGMKLAAEQAMKRLERELKFVAYLGMPPGRDPTTITFVMWTDRGEVEYEPVAVSPPVSLGEVRSGLDPSAPPVAVWSYEMWFPITGGPGYPPIDALVRSLCLVAKDGESTAEFWFDLPIATMSATP